jgi:8-oxo-dGTP diphosphatase
MPASPSQAQTPTEVVCLVLRDHNGFILAMQRPPGKRLGGLWEFPGGKVEANEPPSDALRREIKEELHLDLGELSPLPPVEHTYDFGTIRLLPFLSKGGERPTLTLTEHTAAKWIDPREWSLLDWAPADIPILEALNE